jgi:diaminopimelate decarboxylase
VEHARRLIARLFPDSGAELSMGGVTVGEIAARYGTPVFAYDRHVLDATWARVRSAYPPSFSIAYSVKANPNAAILRHFVDRGAPLEVASAGELTRALAAGCRPENILFAGPGKTERELELALSRGIGEIHVESALEARRISALAERLQTRARAALRVNPLADAQGGAMRMGGKPAPFGVDEECIDEVIDFLVRDPRIDFRGLHLFAGTQILDSTVLATQYRHGVELARRVATRLGGPLATLDFGGGLGVPYFPQERELDLDKLREELHGLVAELEGDPRLAGTRLLIEPGRYLVAEAGVYVTRITDIKVSRGKTFYIVDGGMNHHLAASGNLGQVIKRNFPIAVVNRLADGPTHKVDVVGPLCTPLDTLARDVTVARAEVGDLVGIFQSGAYGLSASPQGFLSHQSPAEVLLGDGQASIIRSRRPWEREPE